MATSSSPTTAPPPDDTAISPQLRRLAAVVVLGASMTILDSTIVNVAVNTLGRDFHTSLSTIQWVLTGYMLALSMTIPLSGWAVTRFGARNTWLFSLGAFIIGSVLCGAAWNVASLVVFRVIQGVGGGLIMPVGQTMLAREAGPHRMGRLMAVVALPAMLAPVLGPIIGGLIVDNISWRWLFFVNVPLCGAALIFALAWLPRHDEDRKGDARLDTLGLALLSPALAALVYGLSEAGNGAPLTGIKVLGSASVGAVLLAAFAVRALRTTDALLDLRLFRHRSFSTGTAALLIYSGSMFGLIVLLPLYYQIANGDSPLEAGLMTAPFGLGAMITMALGGRMSDKRGSRGLSLAGIALVALANLTFTQLDTETNQALLLAATFVVGLGHGLIIGPLMAVVYRGLPRAAAATATTTLNIVIRVGSSFGTALLAIILQIYIRDEIPGAGGSLDQVAAVPGPHVAERLVTAFGHSFWWTAALAAAALIPALLLPRGKAST